MASTGIVSANAKIDRLRSLINSIDKIVPEIEDASIYLSNTGVNMDGLTVDGKPYDKGVLSEVYDDYAKLYNSLIDIKNKSSKEIVSLETFIKNENEKVAAEKRRLDQERIKSNQNQSNTNNTSVPKTPTVIRAKSQLESNQYSY